MWDPPQTPTMQEIKTSDRTWAGSQARTRPPKKHGLGQARKVTHPGVGFGLIYILILGTGLLICEAQFLRFLRVTDPPTIKGGWGPLLYSATFTHLLHNTHLFHHLSLFVLC